MLEIIGNAVIAFIERELIKHEPEIEAAIIDQMSKLTELLTSYVNSKLSPTDDEDVASLSDLSDQQNQ